MVNVSHKICDHNGCTKQPGYGLPNGKPQCCAEHKTSEMIMLLVKLCEHDGCGKQPVYGLPGGKPQYCKDHKLDNMTNVKDKICIYDGCKTRANYNIIGSKPEYCAKHKTKNMVLNPTKKCLKCNNLAIYSRMRCELHKLDTDLTIETICILCGLPNIVNSDSKCEYCTSSKLLKQNNLMTYLNNRGLHGLQTDNIIDGGICGKERPDRIFDFGDKYVIIECDEHQHKGRICICEQIRMTNIARSLGGLPVYFIRWNPDSYKGGDESIQKRYKLCGDLILDIKDNKVVLPHVLLSVIYLYYDNFISFDKEQWSTILDYD